jgi:hypothetical protein
MSPPSIVGRRCPSCGVLNPSWVGVCLRCRSALSQPELPPASQIPATPASSVRYDSTESGNNRHGGRFLKSAIAATAIVVIVIIGVVLWDSTTTGIKSGIALYHGTLSATGSFYSGFQASATFNVSGSISVTVTLSATLTNPQSYDGWGVAVNQVTNPHDQPNDTTGLQDYVSTAQTQITANGVLAPGEVQVTVSGNYPSPVLTITISEG